MLQTIEKGMRAWWKGKPGLITNVASFSTVGFLADDACSPVSVNIEELSETETEKKAPPAASSLKPWQVEIAQLRYECLHPFLNGGLSTRNGALAEALAKAPKAARLSPATAYKLIKSWMIFPEFSTLAPGYSSGGKGESRLASARMDDAMSACIKEKYLTKKERSIMDVWEEELPTYCKAYDCPVPAYDTFRRRIKNLDRYEVDLARKGKRYVQRHYGVNGGPNPLSTGPLHCVQMDFWISHVAVVDPVTRQEIGRPYLSLASCTTTGMPYGYYLSFDPPSAWTAAMTIFRGAMPKNSLLERLGIEEDWPVWGLPKMLHLDNALEYRGELLASLSQRDQHFEIRYRPVREPHFGGSIESRFKALAAKLYSASGSKGYNPQNRPDPKEVPPAYTLDEYEKIIVNLLIEHANKKRRQSNQTPKQIWESYFFDKAGKQIAPLLQRPKNPERFFIECLPFKPVTLQRDGIVWNYMKYDNEELSSLKRHPEFQQRGRSLEVRRDPRDITSVHVQHPFEHRYFKVPATQRYNKPITLWEWDEAKKNVVECDRSEEVINRCRIRRQHVTEEAHRETKAAKRQRVRSTHAGIMKSADESSAHTVGGTKPSAPGEVAAAPQKNARSPAERFRDLVARS